MGLLLLPQPPLFHVLLAVQQVLPPKLLPLNLATRGSELIARQGLIAVVEFVTIRRVEKISVPVV